MRTKLCVLAAMAALAIQSAVRAEQIDNPEYVQWARYKPGTSTTMKQSIEIVQAPGAEATMPQGANMAAMMPQNTVTTKLAEVKPEALTLELTTTTTQMGQSRDTKTTRVVPAKIEKPVTPATLPTAAQGATADMKNMREGTDTVEVGGKRIATVTREFDTTSAVPGVPGVPDGGRGVGPAGARRGRGEATTVGNAASHVKMWTSAEVPGNTVKMETTSKVEVLGDMKMTMTLIDFTVGQ